MHHHPHDIATSGTARLGALVLLALLAAILGCATTGGATKADESTNVKNFKRDYASVAVKKREGGDATGALEMWRQGFGTFHNQLKDRNNADGVAMRATFEEEWPKLSQALDAKVNDALKAGNPYAAIRVVDLLQFPGGRPMFTVQDDSLILASPAARGWRTRTLNRIRGARNLRGEARQAASGGHHGLAMCLAAGAGDTRTRDQQRAQLDGGGGGDKPTVSVLTDGQDPGVIKAFMPYLERRFEVVARAKQQIVFKVMDARQTQSAARTYNKTVATGSVKAISPEAQRASDALLDRFLNADREARRLRKCDDIDLATCVDVKAVNTCVNDWLKLPASKRAIARATQTARYGACTSEAQVERLRQYYEARKSLEGVIRVRDRSAQIYTMQPTTQVKPFTRPAAHHTSARVSMRLLSAGRTVYAGTFGVQGTATSSASASAEAAGKNLANVAMMRIDQHLNKRGGVTDAVLKAPPGPAPADAFVRDTIKKLTLNRPLSNLERAYAADLCGLNPTSIYNDSKLKGALGL